jgi:hypothetical protein
MLLNLPPDVWAMLIGAGVLFSSPIAVVYLLSRQLR